MKGQRPPKKGNGRRGTLSWLGLGGVMNLVNSSQGYQRDQVVRSHLLPSLHLIPFPPNCDFPTYFFPPYLKYSSPFTYSFPSSLFISLSYSFPSFLFPFHLSEFYPSFLFLSTVVFLSILLILFHLIPIQLSPFHLIPFRRIPFQLTYSFPSYSFPSYSLPYFSFPSY